MAVEDLGDTDGWRAFPVDHNPFAASEAVIPEPDDSIFAQHAALLDPNDPREAMLYNPGQQPIENPRLGQTRLQDGRVVQFDRQGLGALTPQKVAAYDRSNRLNELLQYGPVSKDDAIARAMAGEQPAVVTTTRNGVPVKEAAGTTATAPAQVAAQEATRGLGDTVGVNHPASVFARGLGGIARHGFQDGGDVDSVPYTPEDIDQPGPMTETLAHYAGNPEHAMPMRIGAAIGEEGRRIGQGLWSGATLPGDIATGKASMADPATQQRVGSMAGLVTLGAGAMPAEAGALNMGARNLNPLGFYSHGVDVAANLPQKVGTTQQMVSALQKAGVKPVEMDAAGVTRLGETAPTLFPEKVKAADLEQMFHEASPQLQETVLGSKPRYPFKSGREFEQAIANARRQGNDAEADQISEAFDAYNGMGQMTGAPKFDQYTLPGGQNYREVLMHLPANQVSSDAAEDDAKASFARLRLGNWEDQSADNRARMIQNAHHRLENTAASQTNFTSSHWSQPNIVAHLRLNDRTGQNGENLLHMEELQSDWGQAGRDKGFSRPLTPEEDELQNLRGDPFERNNYDWQRATELERQGVGRSLDEVNAAKEKGAVPPGPYVTNTNSWTDLGLKRALIEAARGDYTHLSWTPGADQAARYDLSKHVDTLHYSPGNQQIYGSMKGQGVFTRNVSSPDELPDIIGQEMAKKLLAQPLAPVKGIIDDVPRHTLTGQDLQVGGEGMKGFYDRQVPNQLSKIAKKLDPNAKIGTTNIRAGGVSVPLAQRNKTVPSLEITPLMRQRILQGLPQYRRGGRVGFADGGPVEGLEPVEGNPFDLQPPDRTMQPTDVARAKGFPEPRSPMHARIAAASRDEPEDPSITARGGYGTPMNAADILAGRAGPVQEMKPYEDPTFSGQLGAAMEHGAERLGAPMSVVRSAGDIGQTAGEFTGLDMPHHAEQAVLAAKHGDYGAAAGEALGAIPIVPGAAGVRWAEASKAMKEAQAAGKDSRAAAIGAIRDAQQTQLNRDVQHLDQYTPVPAAGKKPPTGSQNTSAAIRDLPSIDQQFAKAETDPHLIRDPDPKAASFYVGGPTLVKKPADLTALRRQNYGYLASMPQGSDWYDRYRATLGELHGDTPPPGNAVPAGTWSAGMEGQWSAQRPPGTEFGMAQKERSGAIAGIPQRANTGAQHEAFNRALAESDPSKLQLGNKTGEYAQLIEPSRASLPPQATGVNDFRYATQWGYREPDGSPWDRALGPAQHRFVDNETARMVNWANQNKIGGKTDWTGEQAQAAIWVRQKAEQELRDSPGHVEQHLGSMSPQDAYQKAFDEHAFLMGNATIGEHLPKYTTYTTHEAQPGLAPGATGHLPLAANMSPEERQQFKDNPLSSWLSPGGHDRMYSGLGAAGNPQVSMMTRPASPSLGKFTTDAGTEYNPATTGRVVTGLGAKEGEGEGAKAVADYNDADKAILTAGETLRGAIDAQNASAAHRIFKGGSPKEMNALDIPLKGATREQLGQLEDIGRKYGLDQAIDRGQNGVTLTGFDRQPDLGGKSYKALLNDLQAGGFDASKIDRGTIASIYAALEDQWKAGPGSGQVTQTVLDQISRTPELREAFSQNPHLAEIARNRILRDDEAAKQWGGQRLDRRNLLGIIAMGKGWPDRLEQARKVGLKALVPAAASAGIVLYPEAGLPAEIENKPNSTYPQR